jgi:hypothetical protein
MALVGLIALAQTCLDDLYNIYRCVFSKLWNKILELDCWYSAVNNRLLVLACCLDSTPQLPLSRLAQFFYISCDVRRGAAFASSVISYRLSFIKRSLQPYGWTNY